MVQFNFSERTIKAKVVYYGPAQSGKTTNLEQIHRLTDPEGANRLISLNTAQDRTLFFDLLPFSLGAVSGYDFKIQLYTVPGQVQYNATRRVVLAGADAVVFVADSQRRTSRDNTSAFENMKVNLLANRLVPEKVPLVLQYNKQDLTDVQPREDLERGLNGWGRRSFLAVASRGEGVMETFVAVVQEMLTAIAIKYKLKEKGLDPGMVPEVVADAFSSVLTKAKAATAAAPSAPPAPSRVILTGGYTPESTPALSSAPDLSPVSEELLHRAIRSNVELAEALAGLVREANQGLGAILVQTELLHSHMDEARKTAALAVIKREATRMRQLMQELGQAGTPVPPPAPPSRAADAPTPPAGTRIAPPASAARAAPAGMPAAPAGAAAARPASSSSLDGLLREAVDSARVVLGARSVAVDVRVPPGTAPPRCPPPNLRRAATALLHGLAAVSPPGSSIVLRSERKPVLLKTREGEVKRDFLMLALAHPGGLSMEDQQRILQGTDAGPLGEAYRLVRQAGGFIRFAPLPGGTQETRVFLPAA
jgi:signal recognition particle receptor subunit beta